MVLNPIHPDDLEVIADEIDAIDEEKLFNQKLDIESAEHLEMADAVETMMAETFKEKPSDGEFQVAIFKRDGDYGWVEFAGIFDSLDRVLIFSAKEGRELVVAQAGEDFEDGKNLDFFIVDIAQKVSEVLFGVKLTPRNTFV